MEWLGPTLKPRDLLPASTGEGGAAAPVPKTPPAGFSFDDALDIVNPLQHIPVVSTLYRAITHDQIGTPEKIAGDTLFGGLWGLVSSVADSVFEAATGRNFGDTILALVTGDRAGKPAIGVEAPVGASHEAPAPPPVAQNTIGPDSSLSQSLSRKGIDPETAQRALYAYRRAAGYASTPLSPF